MIAALVLMAFLEPEASRPSRLPEYANRVDTGFVFIDGDYMEAPYTIIQLGHLLLVNGRALTTQSLPGANEEPGLWVDTLLSRHAVLIANSDQPLARIEAARHKAQFLRSIISSRPGLRIQAFDFAPEQGQRLQDWLRNFSPPPQLMSRAGRQIRQMRRARNSTVIPKHASLAYPLTIVGMLAGVWSLGHLLVSSPQPHEELRGATTDPSLVKATITSIAGVMILSALDLIWTLRASQAGQMTELNPLGSRLITDPTQLVAFKLAATLTGCGFLLAFRRTQLVRRAAWWLFLVLTLLTFRWLVFNSLFVES